MKPKRCKVCQTEFTPRAKIQKVCGWLCAAEWTKQLNVKKAEQKAKEERKADRVKRERLKTRSDWIKEAQIAANSYVRLRDSGRSCISCDTTLGASGGSGGSYDCGHFLSRGAYPNLRFELDNMFGQCKRCNRYLAGNHSAMRDGVIGRIGRARVHELEADQTPRKWSIEELREIRDKYRKMAKELV